MTMASSLTVCVLFMVLTGVAADICKYELFTDSREKTAYCSYGCCYTSFYPCCEEPFYMTSAFIAPVVVGAVGLFIGFIVIVIIVIRRRRAQGMPTVQYSTQYSTPYVGQHVMSSAGGVPTNPGYGYSQYIAQPMCPGQPVYGTAPMYALQPAPGGTTMYALQPAPGGTTMYMMPAPSGPPPAYANYQAQGTAPPSATQTGNSPAGVPLAYANQHAEGTTPSYGTQAAGVADSMQTKTSWQ